MTLRRTGVSDGEVAGTNDSVTLTALLHTGQATVSALGVCHGIASRAESETSARNHTATCFLRNTRPVCRRLVRIAIHE